jgi:hypothetical protein
LDMFIPSYSLEAKNNHHNVNRARERPRMGNS